MSVDFVSPESISHSYQLTQLARQLPQSQELAEERLQAKTLVFHTVKRALAVLHKMEDKTVDVGDDDKAPPFTVVKEEEEQENASNKEDEQAKK